MSLVGFRAGNHPQQTGRRGADDEVDDRGTPLDFFAWLDAVHGFTLDVAAAAHNARCADYYTRAEDGLARSWRTAGAVWCNPPYSGLAAWLAKAWAEHREHGVTVVMLLPANRCEQPWWQEHVEPYRDRPGSPMTTRFLPGRLRFVKAGATEIKPNERPPFGCVLVTLDQSPTRLLQ